MDSPAAMLERTLSWARIDLRPQSNQPSRSGQPGAIRVVMATVASLVGSLLADAALVAIGTAVFPSTKGYIHFRFADYSKLTIIGVLIAGAAWPVVTRISSAPRWLFFRLAILVTAVLLVPDLWLLVNSAPAKAVAVLVVMHLAIAVVTYNCLVRIAPVPAPKRTGGH